MFASFSSVSLNPPSAAAQPALAGQAAAADRAEIDDWFTDSTPTPAQEAADTQDEANAASFDANFDDADSAPPPAPPPSTAAPESPKVDRKRMASAAIERAAAETHMHADKGQVGACVPVLKIPIQKIPIHFGAPLSR